MNVSVGSMNTGVGSVTVRHKESAVRKTQRSQKSDNGKNSKKKKLNYNFKELSARILRAKTSGGARQAAIMARSRIAMLRAKLNTGDYDVNEVESALIHAEQMERVAKKRLKHMQQEEAAKRSGDTVTVEPEEEEACEAENADMEQKAEELAALSERELRELMQKMQELMEQYMEQMDESGGLEELSEELLAAYEDMEPEDLELRKKKHRSDELMEIVKADMQYLKSMFDRLEREKKSAASGVSLQLGGSEIAVSMPDIPLSAPIAQTPAEVPVMSGSVSVDVSV